MEIDIKRIESEIIKQAVGSLVEDERVCDLVDQLVQARIDKIFSDSCNKKIEQAIDSAIKSGFEREYVKVTSFGTQSGAPTTLAKELESRVSNYWNEKVDAQGNSASGYSAKMTRAEFLMGKIMAADFNEHIKQLVVNSCGTFKDAMRDSLYGSVNEALSGVFKVNSLGDRNKQRTGSACIDPQQK